MQYKEYRSRLQKELAKWTIDQARYDHLMQWIDVIEWI